MIIYRMMVAVALRPVYTTHAADAELLAFADSGLGCKYPATVQAVRSTSPFWRAAQPPTPVKSQGQRRRSARGARI